MDRGVAQNLQRRRAPKEIAHSIFSDGSGGFAFCGSESIAWVTKDEIESMLPSQLRTVIATPISAKGLMHHVV